MLGPKGLVDRKCLKAQNWIDVNFSLNKHCLEDII